MADEWFVMIPPAYQSASDSEKELVDFREQYPSGSQAWADANAGRILSASESGAGQQLVKWKGPFATEDEAKAAQNPQQQSPNPINDIVNAAENSGGWVGLILEMERIWDGISDGKMWRSLGWLTLGTVLILVGTFLWVRSQGQAPALPFGIGVL